MSWFEDAPIHACLAQPGAKREKSEKVDGFIEKSRSDETEGKRSVFATLRARRVFRIFADSRVFARRPAHGAKNLLKKNCESFPLSGGVKKTAFSGASRSGGSGCGWTGRRLPFSRSTQNVSTPSSYRYLSEVTRSAGTRPGSSPTPIPLGRGSGPKVHRAARRRCTPFAVDLVPQRVVARRGALQGAAGIKSPAAHASDARTDWTRPAGVLGPADLPARVGLGNPVGQEGRRGG